MSRASVKWIACGVAALTLLYGALFGAVALAMLQPPERFGGFMSHVPQWLIWRLLPAPQMWLWARKGDLNEGDVAPEFCLSSQEGSEPVCLASHRGERPVVLVFGSYT